MNDTHTPDDDVPVSAVDGAEEHSVEAIASLDPADAPIAAERYAGELAAELEDVGADSADPIQLQADLGDQRDGGAETEAQ